MKILSSAINEFSLLELIEYRNKEMSRTEIWVLGDLAESIPPGPQRIRGIDYYYPGNPGPNTIPIDDFKLRNPRLFWFENCVTIAHMNQVKGNEADFVFVVGIEGVARREHEINQRNTLFTAMTRTKGFLYMSGIGNYPIYAEIMSVLLSIANNPERIAFTCKGAPRTAINAE